VAREGSLLGTAAVSGIALSWIRISSIMGTNHEQREKILQRVAMKCRDFARQLSYHRAFTQYKGILKLYFWRSTFNNAIDLAVLDWLHLFGSHSDDLHWKRVVDNTKIFRDGLLNYLGLDETEWKVYRQKVKEYRDKDVAHIELRPLSQVPDMTPGLKAANYYYKHVLLELATFRDYSKEPSDLIDFHKKSLKQTKEIVSLAYDVTKAIEERVR
jgi:hypothetical protein